MTIASGSKLGRYEIRSQIGAGGMGEVYLVQDTKLDRKVAIKFLPESLLTDERASKRLVREAQAAAKLDHPNICAIHEVGEEDGRRFIAMQYIEGETLDARIKSKPLELKESLSLAAQIADALSEAHSHGIIHRDIKPGNIMITSRGQAKVMDFGLAKLIQSSEAVQSEVETEALLSEPGAIIGTVPYMSPEQVRGDKIDARSDIFSFGVVLYEVFSGRQPFATESKATTAAAILTHEPPPLARYCTEMTEEVQRIVRKCLEKDRERRYQTMRDVALDLDNCRREHETAQAIASQGERITAPAAVTKTASDVIDRKSLLSGRTLMAGALLALAVAVALVYIFAFRRATTTLRPAEISSLAVLPLKNLSGDPAQEFFADGMTEALISNLSQIHAFSRVISRQSVMGFKGSQKSLKEIARELNVDAVIEGSVQRSGGRVLVTARLISAATESPVWARDYDRDLSDVLKLESEVARAVADEIRIQLTVEERARLASVRRIDPAAHEAYLLGRYHSEKFNEEDLKRAIEYFERAIQLAPDYAAAYAELSEAWRTRGILGAKTFKEVEAPARAAALKALALDPNLADGHAKLGNLKYIYDRDWSGAEEEMKRAVALDPNGRFPHLAYAHLLMALGRFPEALTHQQIGAQLDPTTSFIRSDVGRILYFAGKYDEAIQHLGRALELDPRNDLAYSNLVDVYEQMGRYEEALAALDKAEALRPKFWFYQAQRARVYARVGRRSEALRMIEEFKATIGPGRFPEIGLAEVYPALGEKDEAFRLLMRVIEERDQFSSFIKIDHSFDTLHSDPRWKEALRRMNFPPE